MHGTIHLVVHASLRACCFAVACPSSQQTHRHLTSVVKRNPMAIRHALSVLRTSLCRPAVTSTPASTHILRRAFTDQAAAVDAPAEEPTPAAEEPVAAAGPPQTKYPDLDIEALLQDLGAGWIPSHASPLWGAHSIRDRACGYEKRAESNGVGRVCSGAWPPLRVQMETHCWGNRGETQHT